MLLNTCVAHQFSYKLLRDMLLRDEELDPMPRLVETLERLIMLERDRLELLIEELLELLRPGPMGWV